LIGKTYEQVAVRLQIIMDLVKQKSYDKDDACSMEQLKT
jgi:hypothetical protein